MIPGFQVIVQTVPLSDTTAAVWVKSDIEVAGVQAECVCTSKRQKSENALVILRF